MVAAITSAAIVPALLFSIAFRSQTSHVWSGVGPFAYGGNTYVGAGSLGKVGIVGESTEVRSDGMTVTLSGIDATLLGECMTDIQIGAPAALYLACLDQNNEVLGTPYRIFGGTVDKPTFDIGTPTISITLALENRLSDLQRASNRRYTAADQQIQHSTDTAFAWVEQLNDEALRWGN
jgi:hypothetical protein